MVIVVDVNNANRANVILYYKPRSHNLQSSRADLNSQKSESTELYGNRQSRSEGQHGINCQNTCNRCRYGLTNLSAPVPS